MLKVLGGGAIKGEYNKFKRGVGNTGLNNEYQGQNLKDRMNTAKQNIKRNAAAGDKNQDLQGFISQINKMKQSGLLTQQAIATADQLINSMSMQMQGSNGGLATAYNRSYGE